MRPKSSEECRHIGPLVAAPLMLPLRSCGLGGFVIHWFRSGKLGRSDGRYRNIHRISFALSILVASVASYTALDLGGHIGTPGDWRVGHGWLQPDHDGRRNMVDALHRHACLHHAIPMSYDIGLDDPFAHRSDRRIPAWLDVISASAHRRFASFSAASHGTCIVAMHYTGMAAMQGHAELGYDRLFVALSVVISDRRIDGALWLASKPLIPGKSSLRPWSWPGHFQVHYTGMRAAIFTTTARLTSPGNRKSRSKSIWRWLLPALRLSFWPSRSIAFWPREARRDALRQA